MGVFVKGMGMPERCGQCFLRVGNCEQRIYMERRPKGCPLVEVKEPHGRLIDEENVKDAIYERLKVLQNHEVFRRKRGDIDLLGVMPYIAKIPTVIEAEGSENE